MKNNNKNCLALAGLGLALLLPVKTTLANGNDSIYTAFSQYAAEWEQWAWTIPRSVSPLLDLTGESCMVAQRGSVWFLAGVAVTNENGVGVANRTCTIPEGKWLFFPIANSVGFDSPGVCGQEESLSLQELRASSKATIDSVKNPTALVDGKPVKYTKRVQSNVFELSLPEDNVFDTFCGELNVPAGVYSPAVDEGYYAAVEPLRKGKHTIIIRSEGGFTQDITYNLNIVPVKLK